MLWQHATLPPTIFTTLPLFHPKKSPGGSLGLRTTRGNFLFRFNLGEGSAYRIHMLRCYRAHKFPQLAPNATSIPPGRFLVVDATWEIPIYVLYLVVGPA